MNDFKKNRHSIYRITYHLVVVTKYRKKCINDEIKQRIIGLVKEQFARWDCEIIEINGEEDHMHLLFDAPPHVQLSKLINSFKTVTSRLIRKEFEEHVRKFYWKLYFWSQSYMLFSTGGAPLETVKKYIENQGIKITTNPS